MANFKNQEFEKIRIIDESNILDYVPIGYPHRPISNAILFIKKGTLDLKEYVSNYHLTQNDFMFIDRKHVYEVLSVSKDLEIKLVGYKDNFLQRSSFKMNKIQVYRSLKAQLKRNYKLPESQAEIMFEHIELLKKTIDNKNVFTYSNQILEHSFINILYQISGVVEQEAKAYFEFMNKNQKIFNEFILLVSENYLKEKSVEYYASKIGITTRYMSSVIKAETSRTPNEFINDFIINEAKAKLSSTNKNIKDIAFELNFYDQYAFSHFFYKHTNMRPSTYRKNAIL